MAERHPLEERELVRALVTRSARLLDHGRWEEFVDLFAVFGFAAVHCSGLLPD